MLRNYFKIAWRNLWKDRQFTFLNLVGLSTGLACALLIGLWVTDEMSMDKYNEKDQQLYQVMTNLKTSNGIKTGTFTPGLLAKALKDEMPEVEYASSVLPASWFSFQGVLTSGENKIKAKGQYVGKDYFNIFTCHFIAGEKDRLVTDKSAVAISEELAQKLFHTTQNVIGKTIDWNQAEFGGPFIITGVFEKLPANVTDPFDLIFNYDVVLERRPNLLKWYNSDPSTFVVLKKGTDIAKFNTKIKEFIKTKDKNGGYQFFVTKFSDRYLHDTYENGVQAGGRIAYVRIFSIIAIFILVIACINFMNLSTAKASHRAKEVGIQKVVGANRSILVLQYLGESLLMAFLSLILAIVFIFTLLPAFNEITGKQLSLHINTNLVLAVLGATVLTGLLAGSYPAFYLSGFKPVTVLKGKLKTSWAELLARKGLVVFQFTLSVVFIAAVLILYRQVNYIQSKDLGYNRDHIIHFEIPLERDSAKYMSAWTFVKELENIPGVVSASSYSHNLTGDHGAIAGFEWPGKNPNTDIEFANLEVGYNFLETVGIKIKEGRNFSQNANAQKEIIFNDAAIKAMGLKDPIGKTIRFWGEEHQIVGIAQDFNFESLYKEVKPCFFRMYPVMPNVMVKIRSDNEKQTIDQVKKAFTAFNKGMTFDYRFLDEDYQALYASETRIGVLARYFAGLAIIISCLGLFGLAAFTAQRRQKEIGIRKVVGASVTNLTILLSKDFVKLVLVAMLIAFPLVGWAMNSWLQEFAYRIQISADIFLITGFSVLVLTLGTISFQSIKAALSNPVKSLKAE